MMHPGHFQVSADDLAGIRKLASLNSEAVQVFMIQIPVHPSFIGYFSEGKAVYDKYLATIDTTAQSVGMPFWHAENLPPLPDQLWLDRIHMSFDASVIYSEWMGAQLATAVQRGEIRDPTPPKKQAR